MAMPCPVCAGQLLPVQTQNHYGTRLIVDACEGCGGYWLEGIEAVGIGYAAVQELEGEADLTAISTAARDDFRGCPHCQTALEEITGGHVPDGLHIDTCHTCHGLWFDHGELLVYKSALESKRNGMRTREIEASRKRSAARRRMATTSVASVLWNRGGLLGALDGLADIAI